ncbi:uncharacterized protein FOMMEDRAFT_151443 [Fomitiporia mediterranea MF3/22]|uniref:uncharacterized protein n=1 Tax=Fomitiporia mediterranea (strain MF3/22) TaxID=694068 RepID=UPI0004408185|nr:uncharacterized protein FOMMEDRAFT_151443 [Fomitiporia mediterranea MF3/22]EJD08573.1 hypothetical protein FOMMEDRAFT_151443 [Fomitiporia mediterranea MF3/22]
MDRDAYLRYQSGASGGDLGDIGDAHSSYLALLLSPLSADKGHLPSEVHSDLFAENTPASPFYCALSFSLSVQYTSPASSSSVTKHHQDGPAALFSQCQNAFRVLPLLSLLILSASLSEHLFSMDVDQAQHSHSPFPSPDQHFSPQLHQQSQQQQHSGQGQSSPSQQQTQQPSPDSPSQSLSQLGPGGQGQAAQGQNQWSAAHNQHPHPHLLPISVPVAGAISAVSASPTSYSPASAHPTDGYPFYSQQPQSQSQPQPPQVPGADGGHHGHGQTHAQQGMERSASLSLNISSLSVQSPANLSPLTPSPHPSTASTVQTLSPVTPLSPSTTPHAQHYQTHTSHSNRQDHQGNMFAYAPPNEGTYNTVGAYSTSAAVPLPAYARAPSSRSSSAASTAALSTKSSIPRKRSFANASSLPVTTLEVGEPGTVPGYNPALGQSTHELTPANFEDVDVDLYSGSAGMEGLEGRSGGSPGDPADSSSGDGDEDPFKSLSLGVGSGGHANSGLSALSIPSHGGGYGPASAKTTGTNNFVTKLYQCVSSIQFKKSLVCLLTAPSSPCFFHSNLPLLGLVCWSVFVTCHDVLHFAIAVSHHQPSQYGSVNRVPLRVRSVPCDSSDYVAEFCPSRAV